MKKQATKVTVVREEETTEGDTAVSKGIYVYEENGVDPEQDDSEPLDADWLQNAERELKIGQ
ncbi:MAG: hypothetical protein K5739_02150 [Lachnospiraceae bacterium]|nr:hypothetical protein [Lachnospiraceae bacterium]